jgi:glycosyltransferase 2 family protein
MKKSTMLQLTGGLVLAGAGLYIFLRDVDPVQLGNDLKETPVWAITACVLLTVLTLWLRAIRWNLILPKSAGADRGGLFGIVMIGFMVNNFLPARLGEATRMVLLWKRNRFTIAQSVGSVLLERIIDSVFFLSFFFVPALLLPGLRSVIPYAMPMAIFSGGVVLLLLLYLLFPAGMMRGFDKCCAILPHRAGERVRGAGRDLVSNVHWLFNPWKCLVMIVLSFATVFCHPVMMMILIGAKGFGILDGLFCSACAAIGAAIPLSPGYVGTLHAALKQGFILCGIGSSKAIAVATIYHAIGYVTVTVLGLWYFFRMKITFKDISRAKETVDQEKDVERSGPRVGS